MSGNGRQANSENKEPKLNDAPNKSFANPCGLLVMATKANRHGADGTEQNIATVPTQSVGALKLKPAAQYLGGLSIPTIHRLIKRGLLRPNRALRHLLFSREELDRFLREGMSE